MITPRVTSPNWKSTRTTKNKWKATIIAIEYSAPYKAMLFSLYNHSQPLWVWADGTSISTMNLNLRVDIQERVEASIKGGRSNPGKRTGRGPRGGATQIASRRKSPWISSVHLCDRHEHHDQQLSVHQSLAFQPTLYKFTVLGPPAQDLAHRTRKQLRNETL